MESRILTRLKESHPTEDALRQHPLWDGYRAFYSGMNVKPSSVSTPLKQAARILRRDSYRPINPVVDVCMEIEYSTLCSFQVYDNERVGMNVTYGPATGRETVDGKGRIREGELLLSDEHGVIHSPTLGNSIARLVRDDSDTALIRVLKIPAMDCKAFDQAVAEAAERLDAVRTVMLGE